jgi:hypothetical protein
MRISNRLLTLAVAAILPLPVIAFGAGTSVASTVSTLASSAPIPVQDALSIVQSFRNAGALVVSPSGGSALGGVWSDSAVASQHWSIEASDSEGSVVLGISVYEDGTEAVSGWIPGTSSVTSWIFDASNAVPSATYQVTVPGSVEQVSPTGSTLGANPNSLLKARVLPHDDIYVCQGIETIPYTVAGVIYFSASVICNIDAALVDSATLWDYWDSSSYHAVDSVYSGGVTVDYPSGTFPCYNGDSARNSWHTQLLSTITWPSGTIPATGYLNGSSGAVPLSCTYN